MADGNSRETYIPLRTADVIDWLCAEGTWADGDRERFAAFCRLLAALVHHDYQRRLERLKAAYHPFDADADTHALVRINAEEKQRRLNDLFSELGAVLSDAGYRHLSADELEAGLRDASAWGLRMEIDFRAFERLAVFVRGSTTEKRPLRLLRKGLRSEELEVPIFRRVVMILKLRKHPRIPPQIDTNHVYLQLFKNIPQLDVKMLLPGARVRMTYFDRGRVGLPLLSGLALALWQIVRDVAGAVWHFINDFFLFKPAAIWAVATGAFGYGFRSYYGYYQTKQRYLVSLLQVLYFQNLDTNSGVLYRLLDEAEEQDCREMILSYYYLRRSAGEQGWTAAELDCQVEQDLHRRADLQINFKDEACLHRMERLGIVEKHDGRYRARPLADAIERLEAVWTACCKARDPEPVSNPRHRR